MSHPYFMSEVSKAEKAFSFLSALGIHIFIFGVTALVFLHPPQVMLTSGTGALEVNLVVAPSEIAKSRPTPQADLSVPHEKAIVQHQSESVVQSQSTPTRLGDGSSVGAGQDATTVQAATGILTQANPEYLHNPSPLYPESARRRGQEGLVIVTVFVDKTGLPLRAELKTSSGVSALDSAALKAVQRWKFKPAMVGNLPVEFKADVPIRFRLSDR